MSKELDRLEHLRLGIQHINQDESPAFISQYEEDINIIEVALKDYESRKTLLENIDNDVVVFEPKEVWEKKQKLLKELEDAKLPKVNCLGDGIFCFEDDQGMVFMPKAKCEENEKKLKAFDIIKIKKVDIDILMNSKNVSYYNKKVPIANLFNYNNKGKRLVKSEFVLLKEVLL